MTLIWRIADALIGIVAGGVLASAALFVGVVGLAVWAGWSRNRYLARAGWKGVSRWR